MKDKFYLHKAPQEEIDKLLDDKKNMATRFRHL